MASVLGAEVTAGVGSGTGVCVGGTLNVTTGFVAGADEFVVVFVAVAGWRSAPVEEATEFASSPEPEIATTTATTSTITSTGTTSKVRNNRYCRRLLTVGHH